MTLLFKDRHEAGNLLARRLNQEQLRADLVLGIPRGGVVVADKVALAMDLPLDVIVTRKVGAPGNPELAVGAVTSEGHALWNETLLRQLSLTPEDLSEEVREARWDIDERISRYRAGRVGRAVEGKQVILVDDGIATGFTVKAALSSLREAGAAATTLAVPVAPQDTLDDLRPEVDHLVCLSSPEPFWAVSAFYSSFAQVSSREVVNILSRHS